jgi:hypothetical protein
MNKIFTSEMPQRFIQNTLDLCGETGKQWLDNLHGTVEEISKNWSVEVGKPFANLYIQFCRAMRLRRQKRSGFKDCFAAK